MIENKLVRHSYSKEDCIFLLKDVSEFVNEVTVEEKEAFINKGESYSKIISKELSVNEDIKQMFLTLLNQESGNIARYVSIVAEKIYKNKGDKLVIVSLARAGTPFGILVKRYLETKYKKKFPHYSVSIIRGKGIDENAVKYILDNNLNCDIQFIDGWTGKGSITKELSESIKKFNSKYSTDIDSSLAVIADPARKSIVNGTRKDINIPNCCLNGTVSGLVSRTILNEEFIGKNDFHGAKTLDYLGDEDFSVYFIDKISEKFNFNGEYTVNLDSVDEMYVEYVMNNVKETLGIYDIHKVKLSIGEVSRALLRRDTKEVYIRDINNKDVKHIIILAKEKNVPIKTLEIDCDYQCIAIIR